ncbi:capsule biosynthesis protein [Cognatiyoonia sp. IB215182]|uniref:capsule biosynthesis protein n=1 Tax=Cognatiyoonia sp. IB215182 TaxID=3097353 RepID=UPI002A0AC194|nr:capsule biosynthesis protein [Cognatiyoonia sp. IB215182]MDX8354878.1 capsule biosynthesis protein [Cognatiyoonia sp. IB215182]
MTTKPKVKKFRIRRGKVTPDAAAREAAPEAATAPSQAEIIEAISKEGLTGRQLRMARRVAQKNGIEASSDFVAVMKLREAGIDPFQRNSVLELVKPDAAKSQVDPGRIQLPETTDPKELMPAPSGPKKPGSHVSEIRRIQREIAQRRRRKLALLFTRLAVFIFLPTAMMGWYFYQVATPMYATNSEIVIQQAQSQGGAPAGLGTLFQGTSIATQQDSIAVQSYLASREAMLRLDADHNFKGHFSNPDIDEIQRLPEGATNEDAFALYQDHVRISYDPSEGIIRMEVIAVDPDTSQRFSEALIGYAEEQVDQLTARLRADQMQGALASYEDAERRRSEALEKWLAIQQATQQIDPRSESSAQRARISTLEAEQDRLEGILLSRLSVERPSQAQVQTLRDQIANVQIQIAEIRQQMAGSDDTTVSQASRNLDLLTAEEDYRFQVAMVQQALTQMETARIEANRQVRYLSQSVRPIAPDEATYPRAFENTLLSFLIFSGIYLMISLTVSVLREQVSS